MRWGLSLAPAFHKNEVCSSEIHLATCRGGRILSAHLLKQTYGTGRVGIDDGVPFTAVACKDDTYIVFLKGHDACIQMVKTQFLDELLFLRTNRFMSGCRAMDLLIREDEIRKTGL